MIVGRLYSRLFDTQNTICKDAPEYIKKVLCDPSRQIKVKRRDLHYSGIHEGILIVSKERLHNHGDNRTKNLGF